MKGSSVEKTYRSRIWGGKREAGNQNVEDVELRGRNKFLEAVT
jgi:hypothetical protein